MQTPGGRHWLVLCILASQDRRISRGKLLLLDFKLLNCGGGWDLNICGVLSFRKITHPHKHGGSDMCCPMILFSTSAYVKVLETGRDSPSGVLPRRLKLKIVFSFGCCHECWKITPELNQGTAGQTWCFDLMLWTSQQQNVCYLVFVSTRRCIWWNVMSSTDQKPPSYRYI